MWCYDQVISKAVMLAMDKQQKNTLEDLDKAYKASTRSRIPVARKCTFKQSQWLRKLQRYIHTCMHACIHTYIHTCMHTYIHTYIHTYMHAYIHTYIHTYIHAYIHTYIHTCMHTYTANVKRTRRYDYCPYHTHVDSAS